MMEFTCGALQARGTTGDFVGLRCGEIMGPLFKVVSVQHMEYVPQPIGSEPHDEVTLMEGPNVSGYWVSSTPHHYQGPTDKRGLGLAHGDTFLVSSTSADARPHFGNA
jgi:hypothetical protein